MSQYQQYYQYKTPQYKCIFPCGVSLQTLQIQNMAHLVKIQRVPYYSAISGQFCAEVSHVPNLPNFQVFNPIT